MNYTDIYGFNVTKCEKGQNHFCKALDVRPLLKQGPFIPQTSFTAINQKSLFQQQTYGCPRKCLYEVSITPFS